MQDGLAIHERMPAEDKLGGFDAGRWRVGRHGGTATGGDGVSGGMARLRRGGMALRATWWGGDAGRWRVGRDGGAATGWDGSRAGQRGSLYFWHP